MKDWGAFIPGKPVPQPRPKAFNMGGKGARVVSNHTDAIKGWKRELEKVIEDRKPDEPTGGYCEVSLRFTIPVPKSLKNTRGHMRDGARPYPTGQKDGDIDNLAKPVLDILNGRVFEDDKQVVCIHASKVWAHGDREPGVRVWVTEFREFGDVGAMG